MGTFKFKIDEKSLYFGLTNDYERGQTATVSTPINQSKDPNKWHKDIMQLFDCGLSYNVSLLPQTLLDKCLSKTTAKANAKIDYFFEFKKLYLDGNPLITNSSFAIYIKEETDEFITNRKGEKVPNTHLGRLKLHYPISLLYKRDGFKIDNSEVLNAIINQNGGFAYIVRFLEVNVEEKSLNFITSMIGLKGLLLSSVFKKQKGVGKKLLIKEKDIDLEAQDLAIESGDLIDLRQKHNTNNPDFEALEIARAESGRLGEDFVINHIYEIINNYVRDVYHTSEEYPTSPYDIEYSLNGKKKFIEVKATTGDKEVFNMSSGEIKFMQKYKDDYVLILVTNIKSKNPAYKKFECNRIMSMRKEYPSVRFYAN